MNSHYITGLHTQAKWLDWSKGPAGSDAWQDSRFASSTVRSHRSSSRGMRETEREHYEEVLAKGTHYFVSAHFCALVDHARRTWPQDARWNHTDLLSPYGFAWLEQPFTMPKIRAQANPEAFKGVEVPDDFRLVARAIGWRPAPVGSHVAAWDNVLEDREPRLTFREIGPGGTQFLIFQEGANARMRDRSGYPEVLLPNPHLSSGYWPLSYFLLEDGQALGKRIEEFEHVAELQDDESAYLPTDEDAWRHEIQYVYALMSLMSQRVALRQTMPLNRPARRFYERHGKVAPDHVKVILLRRAQERQGPTGEPRDVDWSCQWDVIGHQRNQYRATCPECLAGAKACGRHIIWVEPYVKGPPDKPFKNDQRVVFVADR